MLPGRRNGAGMLVLLLALRFAIFLFVGVNHLESLYRQVNRHFHLNPRFRIRTNTELFANAKVESGLSPSRFRRWKCWARSGRVRSVGTALGGRECLKR